MGISDIFVIIGAITVICNAIIAAYSLVKLIQQGEEIQKSAAVIEEVHKATNSMKDELVAVTRSDARQSGVTEGIKQERATPMVAQ